VRLLGALARLAHPLLIATLIAIGLAVKSVKKRILSDLHN
jgi:hypothetical protein